jgi:hypothetical protein
MTTTGDGGMAMGIGPLREASVDAVRDAVSAANIELSQAAKVAVAELIQRGSAERQGKEGFTVENEPDALGTLTHLVQGMADNVTKRGKNTVDREIYEMTLRSLCPLPPWC